MRGRWGFILLFFVFALGYALPAKAELFGDSYGVGARANGMGGAFTAVADDYMAAYYNMAGLGQIKEDQIGLELMYYAPDIEVNKLSGGALNSYYGGAKKWDPADDSEGNNMQFWTPVVGVAMNVKDIIDPLVGPILRMFLPDLETPNTVAGLVASITEFGDNALRVRALPPDEPHQICIGDQANQVLIRAGVGVEWIEDLFYGGLGVNVMPTVTDTTLYIPNYRLGSVSSDTTADYVALEGRIHVKILYSPQVGVLFTPMDKKLKLGYAFSGHSAVDTDELKVPVEMAIFGNYLDMNLLFIGHFISSYTPDRHRFGIAYNLYDTLLLSCDVVRKMWSGFEYGNAEDYLYSETARSRYSITGILPDGPDFKDTTDIHLGAELKLGELMTARCGYTYMPNPIPDQSGKVTNYIAYDTTILSVGGSINWDNPKMELMGAIRYFMYDGYTVDKTGVTGVTWVNQESYKVEDATAFSISAGLKWWF